MRFLVEDTLALIIDYQEKLMPAINDNENILNKTSILIKGLRELEVPVIVSQQYTKGLGETVEVIKDALGEFTPYDKKSFSLMRDEELRKAIKHSGKSSIIVCGVEADICVLQTIIDLLDEGYDVAIVEDCVGSRKTNDKEMALRRVENEGGLITTYEAILYELTSGADDFHFKAISKLTK